MLMRLPTTKNFPLFYLVIKIREQKMGFFFQKKNYSKRERLVVHKISIIELIIVKANDFL